MVKTPVGAEAPIAQETPTVSVEDVEIDNDAIGFFEDDLGDSKFNESFGFFKDDEIGNSESYGFFDEELDSISANTATPVIEHDDSDDFGFFDDMPSITPESEIKANTQDQQAEMKKEEAPKQQASAPTAAPQATPAKADAPKKS